MGRPFINKAIEIAQKQKCQAIAVWPTQDAKPFYMKFGLNQIAYKIHQIEIDLTKVSHLAPLLTLLTISLSLSTSPSLNLLLQASLSK